MTTPVTVLIPSQFSGQTMTQLTQQIVDASRSNELPPAICFDFSILNFIQPAGLVFLSNLIEWLKEKDSIVTFSGVKATYQAIRYLDDCGFFITHQEAAIVAGSAPRSTSMPYTKVAQPSSHDWLDGRFIPWLSARLDQSAATLAPLRTCLAEIINNIADHTRYDIGGISAQHFPAANRLEIAVADFGLGIPRSVRQVREGLSDADAIILACERDFTTQSTPRNRGAGLDYVLDVVPRAEIGTISIYGGNAIVTFESGDDVPKVRTTAGFCPGTLVQIDIMTDRLKPAPDEEEDFAW